MTTININIKSLVDKIEIIGNGQTEEQLQVLQETIKATLEKVVNAATSQVEGNQELSLNISEPPVGVLKN